MAVHPRVCGEYKTAEAFLIFQLGSPPRVRGILRERLLLLCPIRFTPACAGNTIAVTFRPVARAVHPRVCGEYVVLLTVEEREERFTPACAGNTSSSISQVRIQTVHPRVCGEYM